MNEPTWWTAGAMEVIRASARHLNVRSKDVENAIPPTRDGIEKLKEKLSRVPNGEQIHSEVYLLEQDCRKLLEFRL